jgi:3',5'-cyclic AMP phosphodiesterase CpdA
MFRLAHVTDPHFRPPTGALAGMTMADLLTKRVVGMTNLVLNRRRHHRMELLASLAVDLRARQPEHVAVTGDLSNVALAAEWEEARRWLAGLQMDDRAVTVIPGNHDAYIEQVVKEGAFETNFGPYQTADLRFEAHYPFVRVRDGVALIGVNTCVPTGDLGAWGEIGTGQQQRLEALLSSPDLADKTRVVLLHHPPVQQKGPEQRNLRDRGALVELLARTGADLVLHGHDHRDERATLSGPGGKPIPVVGAGSASYAGSAANRSRYNVYEIVEKAITAITYSHDEKSDRFIEVKREALV